jgi:hypothetical protein
MIPKNTKDYIIIQKVITEYEQFVRAESPEHIESLMVLAEKKDRGKSPIEGMAIDRLGNPEVWGEKINSKIEIVEIIAPSNDGGKK